MDIIDKINLVVEQKSDDELFTFITNDVKIMDPANKQLVATKRDDSYNSSMATEVWSGVTKKGAVDYVNDFESGKEVSEVFDINTLNEVTKRLVSRFEIQYENGEFDSL
jgi:hypothetical protein